MKKLLSTLLTVLAAAFMAGAQDNPYAIDNECYTHFMIAENTVDDLSSDDFDLANQRLLSTAIAKHDEKARTLYYVEQLKRVIRLGRKAPESERRIWNEEVEKAREQLKVVARETGYTQYYYYSYDLAQTYYFNSNQQIRGMQLINQLMEESDSNGDEYGIWQCQRYLAALYQRIGDKTNEQAALKKVVDMYETTKDPLIRRQSVSRQYCDLADTYPVGSDSARLYYNKASERAILHMDTVRVRYYFSQLAALDKDIPAYRSHRDFCLAEKNLTVQFRSGDKLFQCVDKILGNRFTRADYPLLDSLYLDQQRAFMNELTERNGYWEASEHILKNMYSRSQNNLSTVDTQRLEEMNSQYDKLILDAKLARQSQQVTRITILVAVLLTIILVGALIFTWVYIRSLRLNSIKDERRIVELQEANARVRMADEAKTRFVQNMSHEVRTPLNAIVGFSQLLSLPDGSFPEHEKDEFASHIVNNTKMLTMLLDDILNASAMDNGGYRITYEEGECSYMCQAAISSAEHRLQPGVTMRYEQDFEGTFTFVTDPRRVQQILINLLTNACKHTSSGSIVLRCSLTETPAMVTFSVTDTGTGVPADQAEAIFNRFTKLNDFVQGTGLGLSICREIALKMDGHVFLDTSYTEGGARFKLVLPINNSNKI